jgi:hypothetical protein
MFHPVAPCDSAWSHSCLLSDLRVVFIAWLCGSIVVTFSVLQNSKKKKKLHFCLAGSHNNWGCYRNHVKSFSKVNKTTKKIGFSIAELLYNDPKGNKMVHS